MQFWVTEFDRHLQSSEQESINTKAALYQALLGGLALVCLLRIWLLECSYADKFFVVCLQH